LAEPFAIGYLTLLNIHSLLNSNTVNIDLPFYSMYLVIVLKRWHNVRLTATTV